MVIDPPILPLKALPEIEPEPAPLPEADSLAPSMLEINRAAAAEQAGPEAEIVACPHCRRPVRKFLIVGGKCDRDMKEAGRMDSRLHVRDWADVRHRRRLLLIETDGLVAPDRDLALAAEWKIRRQRLRDITTEPNVEAAWSKLQQIDDTIPR